MISIHVCVGGSCHVRGSFPVVHKLKELVVKYNLTGYVSISAHSCMGDCLNGVCVTIDGIPCTHVDADTVEDLFLEKILPAAVTG